MKNFYFSLILFISIILASILCNFYINNSLYYYNICLEKIENNDKNIYTMTDEVTLLKNDFYSKKDMLQLFISKEHINEIEKIILLIENAAYNNELAECRNLSIDAQCLISQIVEYTTAID